jgi:hypothetical protein
MMDAALHNVTDYQPDDCSVKLKHGGNEKFQQGISFIAISCLV